MHAAGQYNCMSLKKRCDQFLLEEKGRLREVCESKDFGKINTSQKEFVFSIFGGIDMETGTESLHSQTILERRLRAEPKKRKRQDDDDGTQQTKKKKKHVRFMVLPKTRSQVWSLGRNELFKLLSVVHPDCDLSVFRTEESVRGYITRLLNLNSQALEKIA